MPQYHYPDNLFNLHPAIDSRAGISYYSLFFALKGKNKEGVHFLTEAYQKGCRHFVVPTQYIIDFKQFPQATFIASENVLKSLQTYGSQIRQQSDLQCIAITGSNGKTIVKEWLTELLQLQYSVVKTPKSYNSQIGVPLSLWHIKPYHQIGIFEAGISQNNEMQQLAQMIQAQIGIFTNIGSAHNKGFASEAEKIKEKALLFEQAHSLIYCYEHQSIRSHLEKVYPKKKHYTWSTTEKQAAVYVEAYKSGYIKFSIDGESFSYQYTYENWAKFENVMHCICCAHLLNVSQELINTVLPKLKQLDMRLSLKEGINDSIIVDDSYSNDVSSLKVALDFFKTRHAHKKSRLILSDFIEQNEEAYQKAIEYISQSNFDYCHFIGPKWQEYKQQVGASKYYQYYKSTQDFILQLPFIQNEKVLLKGGRSFHFEKIRRKLQRKSHSTRMEVHLDSILHNLSYYRQQLKNETGIMVMVKAFAYGSGAVEVAHLLQNEKVAYLAVAYADEGIELRKAGIHLPIMVMNVEAQQFEQIVDHQLEPEIYSFSLLEAFDLYLTQNKLEDYPVHIKLNTGMNRLGFHPDEKEKLITFFKEDKAVKIQSVFSHLVGAGESEHHQFSLQQIATFDLFCKSIEAVYPTKFLKHILNSSGISYYNESQYDMVRLGIGMYGLSNHPHAQSQLEPVNHLYTTISQINYLQKGESVGYSRQWSAEKDSVIATIAIGYADGIDRRFGNHNCSFLVNDQLAPIVGNVCMDMCMIDISEIEGVSVGDEVCIFGLKPRIETHAQNIGTIGYELLTNVGRRVKRIFYSS